MGVAATSSVGSSLADGKRITVGSIQSNGTIIAVGTSQGSGGTQNSDGTVDTSFGTYWIKYTTGAVAGNSGYIRQNPGIRINANVTWQFVFRVFETTNVRQFVGIYGGAFPLPSADVHTFSVLLRHSTAAGDTTWKVVTGSSGATSVTDTGIPISVGSWGAEITVAPDSSGVRVRLQKFTGHGVPSGTGYDGTITSNIMAATSTVGSVIQVETLEAAAKVIGFARLTATYDTGMPF